MIYSAYNNTLYLRVCLTGAAGAGKTSLLLAACRHLEQMQRPVKIITVGEGPLRYEIARIGLKGSSIRVSIELVALPGASWLKPLRQVMTETADAVIHVFDPTRADASKLFAEEEIPHPHHVWMSKGDLVGVDKALTQNRPQDVVARLKEVVSILCKKQLSTTSSTERESSVG